MLTAAQAQGTFSNEFRFLRADETWLTLYEQGMLIRDAAGSPVRLVGITTDITRRKQMEETLRQSEANMRASEERALRLAEQAQLNLQMLETVIDSMKEGVMLCDMQGELVRANPAAVEMHGFASEDKMLRQINESLEMFELHGPDGQPIHSDEWPLARTVREGSVINKELHVRRTDTGKSWIGLYSATTVRNRQGKVLLILKTAVDITQIRNAEQQRRELDMMLKVQHLLVAQREQERLQIARDLHDGPIQDLISLRFTIQSALAMTGDKDLTEILNGVQDEAQKLVTALRGVCNELRPPVLSKFGLAKAILAHTEELQGRSGAPRIELALDDDSGRLTNEARLSLYRIYQESLNNILRHANAEHASVRLQMMPDHLLLDIQDDGAGFDLPADWLLLAQQGHLGLVGIKERTEAIGGSVEITSAPGRGTRVLVILPLGHG
jgi:PAS domain S-box-containing protein